MGDGEGCGQRLQIGLGRLDAPARPQAGEDVQESEVPGRALLETDKRGHDVPGYEDLRGGARQGKALGHHPHHLPRHAVHIQAASHHRGIGREAVLPKAEAEDDDAVASRVAVRDVEDGAAFGGVVEGAAQERRHAKHAEEGRRDLHGLEHHGLVLATESGGSRAVLPCGHRLEGRRPAPVEEVAG